MTIFAKLTNLDIIMLISIPSAILIGVLIFFLAGVHRVPKKHAIIIEKAKEFYCVYDSGTHFKMPIAYQRVGSYCVAPQIRVYNTKVENKLSITYQIEDTKKFHYCGLKFETIMAVIEKENSEIDLTVLQNSFAKYGLKFINIKKADY